MTHRLIPILLPLVLLAALVAGVIHAAPGDHLSDGDFSLYRGNDSASGMTYDGTYFRVVDVARDTVYTYNFGGTYVSSEDFYLAGENDDARGIAFDGTYFYVPDNDDDKVYVYDTSGTHVESADFNLASGNDYPTKMTFDGTYLYIPDLRDDKVYVYDTLGTHVQSADFNLAGGNDVPAGIEFDGTHLYVADRNDAKIYVYDTSGAHVSIQDFDLAESNDYPTDITFDGTYLRVVDLTDDRVYTYEGSDTTLSVDINYGLQDYHEYAALFAGVVSTRGSWTCISTSTAETVRVNNAELQLYGFCARNTDTNAMQVEIHLAPTTSASELRQFATLTGEWWLVEAGFPAAANRRIYDDNATLTGDSAFTEDPSILVRSERFDSSTPTVAKVVEDDDCAEDTDKSGFGCNRSHLRSLADGDTAVLLFSVSNDNSVDFGDKPHTPESLTVSRSSDYSTATVTWVLYDAATQYEIERNTAVQVNVGAQTFLEYGDRVSFMIEGTQAGITKYTDGTVQPHRTYQYRIRARGGDATSWSAWSEYVSSGAQPLADLIAPTNIQLSRSGDSVTVSWTAPPGEIDGYTMQRQELVADQGSTFFANIRALGDGSWLPADSTMYTDRTIASDRIYEYRVAAVDNDRVGAYSAWFRSGPTTLALGTAPANLRLVETGARVFDQRYEFWLDWEDVATAEDYEVEVVSYDRATGGQGRDIRFVTDSTYFHTAFGRVSSRVRARGAGNAVSEWTAWYDVRFSPRVSVPAPVMVDDTADTSTMQLREDMNEVIEAALEPLGAEVNSDVVLQFLVLVVSLVLASASIALAWRRGMAPLGVGMGAAVLVLVMFLGYRLLGTNVAWAIGVQMLVAAGGLYALVRQLGVLRR